jgi:hypothetical protein
MDTLLPKSKKLRVLIATVAMLVARDQGWIKLSEETVKLLTGTAVAYCLGQGAADMGKERAKIEAASPRPATPAAAPPIPLQGTR